MTETQRPPLAGGERREIARIVVPYDVNRLSPNLRIHWREKAKRTKAAREAARLAWLQAGAPTSAGPVRVSMIVRRARVLDYANLWSAAKACLDGVFVKALTPDDSPQWVTLGTVQMETGKAWGLNPECVFVVEVAE